MSRVKRGCCAICDVLVYDVVRSFPIEGGHPYAGEAQICEIGEGKTVKIVVLILTDGSQMSQPLCASCKITPQNLALIWRKNMAAWNYEIEHRLALGANPLTSRQKEQQMKHMAAKAKVVPLGVLHTETRAKDDRYFQRVGR